MAQEQKGKEDESLLVFLLVLGLMIGIPALIWFMNHAKLSYWGLYFAWLQMGIVDWPFLPWVGNQRTEIAMMAGNPAEVGLGQLLWVMTKASLLCGWLPVVVSILTIRTSLRHRSEKVRRNITAANLPLVMSKHCPAVIPVLHYGDLLNQDIEGQESRIHPSEFAEKHFLVREGILNEEKTVKVFTTLLGPKVNSLSELRVYEKALFAVFASRVFDSFENGGKAQEMLDKLNRSCEYGQWNGKPGYPDFNVIRSDIAKYMSIPEARELLKYFQYPSTYLHMLHAKAMKRGKLVSSNFRWLKGMDRSLWYTLNATGRKGPCIESLIQMQTYRVEELAWSKGYRLISPPVADCIEAFKEVLVKEGVLPKPLIPSSCEQQTINEEIVNIDSEKEGN